MRLTVGLQQTANILTYTEILLLHYTKEDMDVKWVIVVLELNGNT